MTGWTNKVGIWGQSEHIRCCMFTLKVGKWSVRGHKDYSDVPLISSEAELWALLCGHTICLAICPLEER